MTQEQLQIEAEKYAERHAFRVPYNGSDNYYDEVDYKASLNGFIAGYQLAEAENKRLREALMTLRKHIFSDTPSEDRFIDNALNYQP